MFLLINKKKLSLNYLQYSLLSGALRYDKTNKTACALRKDSDQPEHLLSLIKVLTVRMETAKAISYL